MNACVVDNDQSSGVRFTEVPDPQPAPHEAVIEVEAFSTSSAGRASRWRCPRRHAQPVTEAHNRQETPLFAKSIERHALRSARMGG